MSTIISSPLKSNFGFSSPNFSVDALGNLIARSITQSEGTTNDAPVDFAVTEAVGGASFYIGTNTQQNPPIEVFRSSTYIFSLDLDVQVFNIYLEDQSTLYFSGVKHSDGSVGQDALSKQSGKLSWIIPVSAPDILYYGNQSTGDFGLITVGDAVGQFSTVTITQEVSSTSTTTGSLTVSGGVGITENLNVGETISASELSSTLLTSETTLELSSVGNLTIRINNTVTGTIGINGSNIPVINTSINNTVIGDITPSSATFVSASITELPTTQTHITNKLYVDRTATALAIAFGI